MTSAAGPLARAIVDEVRERMRQRGIVFWLDKDGHYSGLVERLRDASRSGEFPYPVVPSS